MSSPDSHGQPRQHGEPSPRQLRVVSAPTALLQATRPLDNPAQGAQQGCPQSMASGICELCSVIAGLCHLTSLPFCSLVCKMGIGFTCHHEGQSALKSSSSSESHPVVSDSCNPMDCSPPGSSVPGILQARILEWVAISFSRGSS